MPGPIVLNRFFEISYTPGDHNERARIIRPLISLKVRDHHKPRPTQSDQRRIVTQQRQHRGTRQRPYTRFRSSLSEPRRLFISLLAITATLGMMIWSLPLFLISSQIPHATP